MELEQYSIVLVNFDPSVGRARPCVVMSPEELNQNLKTIVLAPMTTSLNKYPTRVSIVHDDNKGMVALDQIRTVDKTRIIKVFEKLSPSEIKNCKAVIKETFVD